MAKKVLIIGAGPAGATLAIYLKRYNIESIVFENSKSNLLLAKSIENYYGIDNISGKNLYNNGLNKLNELDIKVVKEEVLSIDDMGHFVLKTTNSNYEGDILVLASGLAKRGLNISNLSNLEGKGVSYCATCDAFFYRKKRVGIIGSTKYMESELEVLKRITDQITIFSNGESYQNDNVKVVNDKILELVGTDFLEGVKTENDFYPLDGLFIANGSYNSFAITKHLGIVTNSNGEVAVDSNYMTNYKNIYAIGDLIPDIKQVGVAVSHGIRLANYLFKTSKEG